VNAMVLVLEFFLLVDERYSSDCALLLCFSTFIFFVGFGCVGIYSIFGWIWAPRFNFC
jgi:hypothetical protein